MDEALRVLYEDNHLIGVIKPCGVLSQSDGGNAPDMLTLLSDYLREKYQKPGAAFVGLVHRLDRNVGGVMLFAKTSKGASRVSARMREGDFFKGYFALAVGGPPSDEGYLRNRLLKDEKMNRVRENTDGKPCVLYYRKIALSGTYGLYFAVPITGRTHQIRAQFAFAGSPLAGDGKYGTDRDGKDAALGLWSAVVAVPHPVRSEETVFLSGVPDGRPWSRVPAFSEAMRGFLENFDLDYYKKKMREGAEHGTNG